MKTGIARAALVEEEVETMAQDEVAERYQAERSKRLRQEGVAQYRHLDGELADLARDRFVEQPLERPAVERDVAVTIVGAGLAGLLGAARLAQRGVTDLCIMDRAGDFGGTWYWNRYPGVACDIESYVYMPLLEETGYMPTQRYASGPEIFAHCQRIGRQYDLYDKALFQTTASEARWLEDERRWLVTTDRGDRIRSRFLITAGGIFYKPKLPGIPGIETFGGASFHSSRWNYAVTGGGPTEPMDRLGDKRVALIGTGCTAVQILPRLAETAEHVYLFQRTPSAIGVRGNRATDPDWAAGLAPGWQRRRVENFTHITNGTPVEENQIDDGWTELFLANPDVYHIDAATAAPKDLAIMEGIRARVASLVDDPATAAALQPWYNLMCKRPTFHDEYLQVFNRPNVTLVDTQGRGVERITPTGLVANGEEYPADIIVYASGFDLGGSHEQRMGFETYGVDGRPLSEAWAEGAHTLHGMHSHGFPNLFMFSLTQSGIGINFAHVLDEVAIHAAWIISEAFERGVDRIEATEEAEQQWFMTLLGTAKPEMGAFMAACTPGYYNGEGAQAAPTPRLLRSISYAGGTMPFIELLDHWRRADAFEGLALN